MHILQPLQDKTAVEIWKQNLFPFPETRFSDMDQSVFLRFIIRSVVWRSLLSVSAGDRKLWMRHMQCPWRQTWGWSSGEVLYEESLRSRRRMWSSAYRPVPILDLWSWRCCFSCCDRWWGKTKLCSLFILIHIRGDLLLPASEDTEALAGTYRSWCKLCIYVTLDSFICDRRTRST